MASKQRKTGRGGRRVGAGRKPGLNGWLKLAGNFFYVLHEADDDRVCKIGIARQPFMRLVSHQTSNWRRLKFAAIYSCPSEQVASAVEKFVCSTLKGRHVLGEWFAAMPADIEREVVAFNEAHGVELLRINLNDYRRTPHERNSSQKAGSGG